MSMWSPPESVPSVPEVAALRDEGSIAPAIVSISDIHGYLADARSALLAVGETDRFDPVVTADDDGLLH
jgi:hypothetical protein